MLFIILSIIFTIFLYVIGAGATHGYAKHRWPSNVTHYGYMDDIDKRGTVTAFWPFYWLFIWPCVKVSETTFSHIEKQAAHQLAKNKVRIEDLCATRVQVEASNAELEQAEIELEKEISKLR